MRLMRLGLGVAGQADQRGRGGAAPIQGKDVGSVMTDTGKELIWTWMALSAPSDHPALAPNVSCLLPSGSSRVFE